MNRLWAAVVGLGLAAGLAAAASPDPKELAVPPQELSRARELVRQLGSESFKEREQAQDEMAKMGRLARAPLAEARGSDPNREVRARPARLRPRAEAADLQARIDTFLADTDGKYDHDLPGWALFRKELAADKAGLKVVRDLYVEAIKSPANVELLTAVEGSAEGGGKAIADRRLGLFLQQNPGAFGRAFVPAGGTAPKQPTLADITVLLLAEVAVPGKDVPRTPQLGITGAYFVNQPASMNAVNNPGSTPYADAYRRVLMKWLDTRTTPEDLASALHVAQTFRQFKEGTALLRRAVTTDGVQGYTKGQALVYLVQRHGKEEDAFIRGQLKNDATVNTVFLGPNPMGGAVQATCQLRDMALALLIAQAGQNIKDYHYTVAPGNIPNPTMNPYPTYAFLADEDRDKAFKKWAAFEAKQKDEPKKGEKK